MSAISATQRQGALDFIRCLDNREYQALADLLSERFTHRLLPASLGGMGMASRNKQQFLDLMKALEEIFQCFGFQPPEQIVQSQDIVIIHLVSDGKMKSGKQYNNEYMFTFDFEGEKIVSVKEFMDSKYVTYMIEEQGRSIREP